MKKIVHLSSKGYVEAIEIKHGYCYAIEKGHFIHYFIENRTDEMKSMLKKFDMSIYEMDDKNVFVEFKNKPY